MLAPEAKAQDALSFEGETVANQMYEAGVAIGDLVLPEATGGSGDLTYALSPLPPGLAFDAATRTLSGTPSDVVTFPEKVFYLMAYEVTDADGATASLTFNISVEEEDVAPSFDGATVADQMFSAGVAIDALELPAASSGNGDLTYSLRPVPPGLAFDAGSRTLSGTPSEVAISLMTYEVTDADGDTATLTFELEVDTRPSFEGATIPDQSYRTGDDIGVLELPPASVGDYEKPPRYSLSSVSTSLVGELPEGLVFDAEARTLSGTPTIAGTYEMTYRVEDSDTNMEESDAEKLTFTIHVELTFAAVAARQTTFTAGEEIKQPWELPVGRSTDALTYSLIGELPAGLSFDPATRMISGSPPTDVLYDAS
ncbi:MAG: putative Ig domain-containing protein, partial [Gemmatimonadetes bacterium]|nr:putative Ig domain-containing protein [Gemmatimonadota bacterium]